MTTLPAKGAYPLTPPTPSALVLHCSDPRFQGAFRGFLQRELGLAEGAVMPLVVGGGAGVLAHPERLPKEFRFVRERLEFYRNAMPTLRRLVLINHDDCLYYRALKRRVLGAVAPGEHRAHDELGLVRSVLERTLPGLGLGLELYFARIQGAHVSFERTG